VADDSPVLTRPTRLGWVGLVVTSAVCVGLLALAVSVASFLVAGALAHLLAGVPVWWALLMHEGRRLRAAEERLELDRLSALAAREGRESIFREGGVVADAQEALERFRARGFLAVGVVVALLEVGGAGALVWLFPRPGWAAPHDLLIGAAALCGVAFGLLLLGRYAFSLGQQSRSRELEAGGRRAVSGALVTLVAGLGLAVAHLGWTSIDSLGYVFVGLSGLLGLEAGLMLLLEAYRPRRLGEYQRPVFDSRLLGLVTAPRDLAQSIARTLDYQFGFSFSQTWFYRFLERWVVPITGFGLVSFWLMSSLAVVEEHQVGLLRRLGRIHGAPLEPGLHVKLPWPIDEVEHVDVGRLLVISTGQAHEVHDEHDDHDELSEGQRPLEQVVLWSEHEEHDEHDESPLDPFGDREDMLVLLAAGSAGDAGGVVNLLAVGGEVAYRIDDPRAYATVVQDPQALLAALTERELSFMLSGEDLDGVLAARGQQGAELRRRVARQAERYAFGVQVDQARLTDLHPPQPVAEAFESLTTAQEQATAIVLAADAAANLLEPQTQAEVAALLAEASTRAQARVGDAQVRATRFAGQRALHAVAPQVFRATLLMDLLVEEAAGTRKVVVGRRGVVDTDLDLADRVSVDDVEVGGLFAPAGEGQ
jgi:modulator of FtsH protease HflK